MLHRYVLIASLSFEVPETLYTGLLSFAPQKLSDLLAKEVIAFEKQKQLGYFPALQYLFEKKAVSQELVDAYEIMCRCVEQISNDVFQRQLKNAFSQVQILNLHHCSYNLPPVLPRSSQQHLRAALSKHYQPNQLIAEVELMQFHKRSEIDNYESFASHLIYRWLKEYLKQLTVTIVSSKVV